jgi:hypothetical protein
MRLDPNKASATFELCRGDAVADVVVYVDLLKVAQELGGRAMRNKSHGSTALCGAISMKAINFRPRKPPL